MSADIGDDPAVGDLRGRVVRGVSWVLVAQVAIRVMGLAATVTLARLLTPREIGLAAEALVFSRFAFQVADVGLLAVLVQRKELSDDDRSTAFWTSAALGVVVSGGLVGLSGPIAHLYGEPRVGPMVAVLAASVLFTALGLTAGALLTREMRFRSLELRSIATAFAGAVTVIVAAALGSGPWAIVVQSIAVSGLSTVLLWRALEWRPQFVYSLASLRGFAGFSGFVFASGLLSYMHHNADNLLVGRFLGAAKLGAYSIAYNVMSAPRLSLAAPVQNVFFPAMSKIRDPRQVGAVWIRVSRLVAAVTVPSFVGMIVVAPDFVRVVFGSRWEAAIPVLQILAYVGILQAVTSQRTGVLLALDRTAVLFRLTAVSSTLSVLAFAAGLHWGIVGVATAYAIASTGIFVYTMLLVGRVVHVPVSHFLRSMSGVAQAAAVMGVAVLSARLLLVDAGIATGARLAIAIAIGLVVFVPLCAWRAPEIVGELRSLLERRRDARTARGVGEQAS